MPQAVLPGQDTLVECWRALTRLSAGARVRCDSAAVVPVLPSWTPLNNAILLSAAGVTAADPRECLRARTGRRVGIVAGQSRHRFRGAERGTRNRQAQALHHDRGHAGLIIAGASFSGPGRAYIDRDGHVLVASLYERGGGSDSSSSLTSQMAGTMDQESAEWLRDLTSGQTEAAQARLHAELLRVARAEAHRRAPRLRLSGPELDDLTHQAAADALLAILAKLGQFRGQSRFATWAYKFVIFEVSTKIGRHFWRRPGVSLQAQEWDRLPDRFGFDPARASEAREFAAAVRRAVDDALTERQRQIFVAIVVNGVPLDALVVELRTSRNAIYKTLFDARRKLRATLIANGYLDSNGSRCR
jgi:RNA polymerase sigma-70 factor (ECF subfamily)